MFFSLLVSLLFSFLCVLLFVAVVVDVVVVLFLPTYYFFTSFVQVIVDGTSPFCHSSL